MMKPETFKKVKMIMARIGIVLIVGMYILMLVVSLIRSEFAQGVFMAALYCTIVVPVIIWGMEVIYKLIAGKGSDDSQQDK